VEVSVLGLPPRRKPQRLPPPEQEAGPALEEPVVPALGEPEAPEPAEGADKLHRPAAVPEVAGESSPPWKLPESKLS